MAFPFYTKQLLENTKIIRNDKEMSLAVQSANVNTPQNRTQPEKRSDFWTIFIPLLIILIEVLYFILKKHYLPYLSQIILIISGLLGIIIFYLSVISIHPIVKFNYNILWCSPLNIILGIILLLKKNYRIKAYASTLMLGFSITTVFLLIFEVQTITFPLFCWYLCILSILILSIQTYSFALKKNYKPRHKRNR